MSIDKPSGDEAILSPAARLPPDPQQRLLFEEAAPEAPPIASSKLHARKLQKRTRVRSRSLLGLALIGGATLAAALFGRSAVSRRSMFWYRTLKKPSWTPPDEVFGLVWPVLYGLSAVSAWRVWRSPKSPARSAALGMWAAQIASNAAWTSLFFGKKRPALALVDVKANLGAAAGYAFAASRIDKTAGLLMLPYVAWVTFASAMNSSVVRHNSHGPLARLGVGG
jgi:translocator protein